MTVKIRVLSLIATAMFSTVTAQYNALNNLTDTYYPKDKNYSVYICANSCIDEVVFPPDCDLSSRSCWCTSPSSNLIDYACCFSNCTGTVEDATQNIRDWCSAFMSSLWEPPTCVNGEAEYTTASSSDTSNYDDNGTDGSSPGLSGGAVAGIAVVGLSSFIVFLLLLRYVGHRRSQKIAATASASAPALPLQRIQIRDQAPPRAQTPPPSYLPAHPPPYSEMPLDTHGPKD